MLKSALIVALGLVLPLPAQSDGVAAAVDADALDPAAVSARRRWAWATQYAGWEVLYDGRDSAADNVPAHLAWDNPLGDDWNRPRAARESYMLNTPSRGFMTVDRVKNPEDHRKTGLIWRRDELLRDPAGLTMEFRIKLMRNSQPGAIFAYYVNEKNSATVYLSPRSVQLGPISLPPSGVKKTFDTTNGFHVYRLVKYPNSRRVELYIDNKPVPFLATEASTLFRIDGRRNYDHPYVLIGDNATRLGYSGHFVLDYIRYRRGAFPPGVKLPAIRPRTPPALPPAAPAVEAFTSIDGVVLPNVGPYRVRGTNKAWKLSGGIMEFDSAEGNSWLGIEPVPRLIGKKGVTIEIKLKMAANSANRAFALTYEDGVGASSLVFSPGKIESFLGPKPVGFHTYAVDLTSAFHIVRMVRMPLSLYYYVYLDNRPTPILFDQHVAGNRRDSPSLIFGTLGYPVPNARAHAFIDYVRWRPGGNAPPR